MKHFYPTRSKTILATLVTAIAIMCVVFACKKPTEGINIIVDTAPLSKAPVLVQFTNSNPYSTTVLPASFTVSITGPGAGLVQVDGGGTNFTAVNGLLPLCLTKAADPSVANPVVFNIFVSLPGFAPMSQTVTVTSTAISSLKLPMIELANPADGTTAAISQFNLAAGVTTSALSVATTTTPTMAQTASISIPNNTQMMDANGTVINASMLYSNVVQYGTTKTAALAAYPGGFSPANPVYKNGTAITSGVHLVPASSLNIDMTAGTTTVSKFSQALPISVELQPNLTNFNTGKPIAVGDTIPEWSLNQTTGKWTLEGKATVVRNNAGNLAANFSITHLTVYDLSWWWASNGSYNSCFNKLQINLHPSSTGFTGEKYRVQMETPSGDQLFAIADIDPRYNSLTLNPDSLPAVASAKLTVYNTSTSPWTVVGTSATFAPCSTSSVDVNFTGPGQVDVVNAVFSLSALCTNKQVVAYPSGWIYFYDVTAGTTVNAYFSNGHVYNQNDPNNPTAQFINGHQYYFATTYSGVSYKSGTFTLDKSNIVIPAPQAGVGFNGGATYDASTNTISVTAAFTLSTCN